MRETVTCPQCTRHLELPGPEFLGQTVQCPGCQTSFVAGAARPVPPRVAPEAISTVPIPPAPPVEDLAPPLPMARRRARSLPPAKKSPVLPILLVVGFVSLVLVGGWCLISQSAAVRQPAPNFNAAPQAFQPQPFVNVPDRILNADEQQEHAKNFFQHFSNVMRQNNNAGEVGCFDTNKMLDTLFDQGLVPAAWQNERGRLSGAVGPGILQTSLYRGEHWNDFEVKAVKNPRVKELIVVTRHPHRDSATALRFRWWLSNRGGRWLIEDVEDFDYGVRLSLLVAAGMQPVGGQGPVQPEVRTVRDAANAIVLNSNFAEAERLLTGIRAEVLPKAAVASHHMLMASVRIRQQRHEDTLAACDLAQKAQPDLPGADYLRAVANNNLHRGHLAHKHAKLAHEWMGDDPLACYELGLALHDLRRFPEAAVLYRKVLDDNPNNQDAMISLLRCIGPGVKNDDIAARFLKLKRPQDQFEQCAKDRWNNRDASTLLILADAMRKLEPRNADAHFYAALAQAEQGKVAPALAAFGEAVALQDFEARREHYFTEFARSVTYRDQALEMYGASTDKPRSFRALGDALKNAGRMEELKELIDLHVKEHPKDEYLAIYQAEIHLRDEKFAEADKAFTRGFAVIQDPAVQNRFSYSRVRARYQTGDVLGAYRDIGPQSATFQQLANSCWLDKKADDLANLVALHAKNDPGDHQLQRARWRSHILNKQFDEAGKVLRSIKDPIRLDVQDFLFDMVDAGHAVEGYRQAPEPAEAVDILVTDLGGGNRAKEREAIVAEHRQRFPKDPILLMYAGQQAADKQDWPKAAQAYADGWKLLPEAKRPRWNYGYMYARVKEGKPIDAYQESGKRPEQFRQLVSIVLQEKQIDVFERLLDAHRHERANDKEFDAYEARLKILRGKPEEAAPLLAGVLKDLLLNDHRRIGDAFLNDLRPFDVAAEAYRCMPDKLDAFGHMVFNYRNAERVKEFERLLAEHAKHQPDDPRLFTERAELHMLRKDYAEAERQFLLAREKAQEVNSARFGLMRARIKLGKTAEAYKDAGANQVAFYDVAQQCFTLKEGAQLESLLAAYRKDFPAARNLSVWSIEASYLQKDYDAVVKAIEAERATLLKTSSHRWKCEGYLVRSLVRLKKVDEAIREAESIAKRKDGTQLLLALALASKGDVKGVLAHLETKMAQRYLIEDCYYDEDLGPLLRSDAFRAVRDRYPPPPERKAGQFRFDDWD